MEKQRDIKRIEPKKLQSLALAGAAILLLLGLLLTRQGARGDSLETRLSAALSQLEGAGRVKVVIYERERTTENEVIGVFSSMGAGTSKQPGGVLVLAQGADDLRVRLDIARAVQSLLGVPASGVEVLKMAD